MVCPYCSALNVAEEHRCGRCGRKLADERNTRRPALIPVQQTATAPVLDDDSVEAPPAAGPQLVTDLPRNDEQGGDFRYQASLFGPQEVSKVAPPAARRTTAPSAAPRTRPAVSQQSLNFDLDVGHRLPGRMESAVYSNAPVARTQDRAVAATLDTVLVVMAVALFAGTVHLAGHALVLTEQTLPVYGIAALLIALFYRVIFCIGNTDTAGVQWAGLRLLNFDGRRPTRRQRWNRLAAGLVSLISTGIGVLWALFDEKQLTWHDYISKTFPSPRSF